jgi:hypothetical protein
MTTNQKPSAHSRLSALTLPLLFLLSSHGIVLARDRDLTVVEARELAFQALFPTERRLPKLDLSLSQSLKTAGFYQFEVTWDNPNPGSVVVGYYAVNVATGDVWKLVVCRKIDSAELRRMQRALRTRIGLRREELRRLTDNPPCEP